VRRDLSVALLWGTPIALAFGLLAALGTTITTMFIAAFGVWYGGAVDSTIQRITEVVLILPLLPILIMVGTFYSRSIWVMLGVVILLSIFGSASRAIGPSSCRSRRRPTSRPRGPTAPATRASSAVPGAAHHPAADPAAGGV
jgi:hypothetical protein